ncbi:TPA: beta-galactosidase [Enterococcus faecium]|nr:beta-galactosidase [Enterococcus faecium]
MKKQTQMYYGADYNPEQWSKDVILEDMTLMKQAGVNYVSINIFGWVSLQPNESTFDFSFLDWLIDLLYQNEIMIDLANGTASPPAWLVNKYPDMMPMTIHGNRLVHGSRQHYCPTSETYRHYAAVLSAEVAKRYHDHPGIVMWHINNEYTCHIHECYCARCRTRFQQWLEDKYQTIDALNTAWSTKFWSQSYREWHEIFLPEQMPTSKNPAQQLDYARFISAMNLEIYLIEKEAIATYSKNIPFMTNLMGLHKYVDGFKWAPEMDVVSWNTYPNPFSPMPYPQFLANDLTRSLKKKPFLIMEQAPSAVNWREVNGRKKAGQMRLWSYEAIAHGSDGIMFFQWRQSRGGAEKFHSAVVPHGQPAESRVFKECCQLGNELKELQEVVGTQFMADVAVVFDWENWWALELDEKPRSLKYIHQMSRLYEALRDLNVTVDFVHPDEDISAYRFVIAPNLYSAHRSFGKKINNYVANGGVFLTNFFSGIVNENDQVYLGGYPGLFKETLGITVEEFSPLKETMHGKITFDQHTFTSNLWEEVIHLDQATSFGYFANDDLKDSPAITVNHYGDGYAYYIGTELAPSDLSLVLAKIFHDNHLEKTALRFIAADTPVSVTCRKGKDYTLLFLINHTDNNEKIVLKNQGYSLLDGQRVNTIDVPAKDVQIIKLMANADSK